MQVVLGKKEKDELVVKLYQDGKNIRTIAQIVHLSFSDIGKIIRKMNGQPVDICARYRADCEKNPTNVYCTGQRRTDGLLRCEDPQHPGYKFCN